MTRRTLEEELSHLIELDRYREQAKDMLDNTKKSIEDLPEGENWSSSQDEIEFALIARAQKRFTIKPAVKQRLLEVSIQDSNQGKMHRISRGSQLLPTLTAARVMQALVATSELAFNSVTLQCYYRIVRELYSASGPDWNIGGARAGHGGRATAFVTGECVRAILAFEDSLLRTSTYFLESHELRESWTNLQIASRIEYWQERECERLALAWTAKTDVHLGGIALDLSPRKSMERGKALAYTGGELKKLDKELRKHLRRSLKQFEHARETVEEFRKNEKRVMGSSSTQHDMQETGHLIGLSVINKAVANAEKALGYCPSPNKNARNDLKALGDLFRSAASEVRKILKPAQRFLETILDHELAAASTQGASLVDIPELAFSAASLGATAGWQDERLSRACQILEKSISEQGEFPVGRPIQSTNDGFRIDPVGFEVIRACAQVWTNTEQPADLQFFSRMLRSFHRLSVPNPEEDGRHLRVRGWTFEHCRPSPRPSKWATALALLSLRQYTRMLDAVINRTVLKHFDSSTAKSGDLVLDTIMHTDVGLGLLGSDSEPIHVLLEQLRSHIVTSNLPKSYQRDLFSVVLHGPPGTGKTSLLSALANSCNVPLVNVSPSDFIVRGQEGVERRARAICSALSLLSNAVIILDEFEPILLDRQQKDSNAARHTNTNIMLSALTPSMLPKLSRLYSRAERQNVVYGLVTNHYHKLDSAAIRTKRFDHHSIVLPPDPLSRAGYILKHLAPKADSASLDENQWSRLERVLAWTSSCSVQLLTKHFLRDPLVADYILNDKAIDQPKDLKKDREVTGDNYSKRLKDGLVEDTEERLWELESSFAESRISLTNWLGSIT